LIFFYLEFSYSYGRINEHNATLGTEVVVIVVVIGVGVVKVTRLVHLFNAFLSPL
jgi:hypothetical protein